MTTQALYRRWRPQTFEDVVGQEHVTTTLRHAIDSDRLAHAYLFTGPRGTGKTSVARILAKALNCVGDEPRPCNACAMCTAVNEGRLLDLIEIDAASNTGVDDVRDLREKVGYAPNEARYKVYIVDEVHMLSTAAFNALLKTLEEPPEHVVFVLATTEPHKIPDTILSRCQRYDFRRVAVADVAAKLRRICDADGVEAEDEALELVARSATGSIRDAESLLDLLIAAGGEVTVADVQAALGTATSDAVAGIVEALIDGDPGAGLEWTHRALDQGADPRQLQAQLLSYLRGLLLLQLGVEDAVVSTDEQTVAMRAHAGRLGAPRITSALARLNEAAPSPEHTHPGLPLEIALVELTLEWERNDSDAGAAKAGDAGAAKGGDAGAAKGGDAGAAKGGDPGGHREPQAPTAQAPAAAAPAAEDPAPKAASSAPPKRKPEAPAPETETETETKPAAPAAPSPESAAPAAAKSARPGAGPDLPALRGGWPSIISAVEAEDRNLAALLKDCRPESADDSQVTLGFFYDFHCRRASEPERKAVLRQAIATHSGVDRELRCIVVEATPKETNARPRSRAEQAAKDPLIQTAVDELGARITTVGSPDDEASKGDG